MEGTRRHRPKRKAGVATVLRPNAVYDKRGLADTLRVPVATISKATRLGDLVARPIANADFYLGADVLAWIASRQKSHGVDESLTE